MIQFDLGLLELAVDYLKEKTKTEKAFFLIDCPINDKIKIFYDYPTRRTQLLPACLKTWNIFYNMNKYITCPKSNNGNQKLWTYEAARSWTQPKNND